jgi:hypothetical protein
MTDHEMRERGEGWYWHARALANEPSLRGEAAEAAAKATRMRSGRATFSDWFWG